MLRESIENTMLIYSILYDYRVEYMSRTADLYSLESIDIEIQVLQKLVIIYSLGIEITSVTFGQGWLWFKLDKSSPSEKLIVKRLGFVYHNGFEQWYQKTTTKTKPITKKINVVGVH
jgi:hypothetical protein